MGAVSLRLPDDIAHRLQQLAARTGRTTTFYMLEAIREHLAALEDLYLAEQRLCDLRSGKSQTVPLATVLDDSGVADRACPRGGAGLEETRPSDRPAHPDLSAGPRGRSGRPAQYRRGVAGIAAGRVLEVPGR